MGDFAYGFGWPSDHIQDVESVICQRKRSEDPPGISAWEHQVYKWNLPRREYDYLQVLLVLSEEIGN
jgi:hypothetical protein